MAHSPSTHRMTAVAGAVAVLLGVGTAPALASASAGHAAHHLATTSLRGFAKKTVSVQVPDTVVDQVTVRPRAHRLIKIQAQKPGSKSFVTVDRVFSDKHGDALVSYAPTKAGGWHFRLLLPATRTATTLVSASRLVKTTVDSVAPGPVTNVNVVQGVGSELSLSWTNPTDPDFAGVMIRRVVGATAPASPTAGTLVTTTDATATSFTDQGLAGSTTYSYALFAFDAAQNKSIAANRTVTSGAATTAALSLNNSTGATAKQTVGQSQSFDLTGTHAGKDLSIASGTLDYGDGTTEEFVGDPSTWAPTAHQYDVTGPVTAKLTVVDSAAKTVTKSLVVTVFDVPSVTATVTSIDLEKGQPITFAVTSSTPTGTSFTDFDSFSDGGTDFVSGAGAPPATFTITFDNAGTHSVTVEGFNDAGGLATVTIQVVIIDAPPAP
jgi:hypothetical protein